MESEEEYARLAGSADTASKTMWILLILFVCLKMASSFEADAMFSTITYMQLIVFQKNIQSLQLPAPAELTYQQFDMMVMFNLDHYQTIEAFIY